MSASRGKQRGDADDSSLGSRVADSARALASDVARPSIASTSSLGSLSVDGKPVPAELSRKGVGDAAVHAEAGAGSTSVRYGRPSDERASTAADADFEAFRIASAPASHPLGEGEALSSGAAIASSRGYDAVDLAPRPTDGADVLALLDGSHIVDLDAEDDLFGASPSPWSHADSDLLSFDLDPHRTPYLHHLLASPFGSDARADDADAALANAQTDGAAIVRYLQAERYSDDVWSLPAPVRQLVLAASGEAVEPAARDKAVARLGALARQLRLDDRRDEPGAFARAWAVSQRRS